MSRDDAGQGGGVSLALRLEAGFGASRISGVVTLASPGGRSVRLWRPGNSWGDTVLSFELHHGAGTARIIRKAQEYTRNVPAFVDLPPSDKQRWPFTLGADEWETDTPIDQLDWPGSRLIAVYEVPGTPEARENGVWTGRLQSAPALLE
jgi:hypothetical protein